MSRNTIRIIVALAAVLFFGLVSTQIVWVKSAYSIAERQTQHEIEKALTRVVQDIQRHNRDSTFLIDPVKLVTENFYRVQINEELQPYYLESMLKTEFLNSGLNFDFQYSIYNCFNDSVVYTQTVLNDEDAAETVATAPNMKWNDDGHYFSVFFPTLDFAILRQMKFWIGSSLFLLAVLLFFSYVISVILKQRRLSEIKNDFINNMTHELKTPISTIALSSDVLLQPETQKNPDRIQNYAQIIKTENQRLQSQVERVLQMAKLEQDDSTLNKEKIDIHEVIDLAVSTMELNYQDQEVIITTNLQATQTVVFADEMHITNILLNLIDNAAKYSGDKPEIMVSTTNKKDGIAITVKDNGPGISREHQKMIFEKFYRISTGNVHDVKGFGIGLHYVRTITEAHDGSIKLVSNKGEGSSFEIYLPFGTEIVNS